MPFASAIPIAEASEKMNDKTSQNWRKTAISAAFQIKIAPKKLDYIEARGLLCHELLCLLGGSIEFVETSWSHFILKILEFIFPISPICRWYPLEDCTLEWVGYHSQCETKVYRLTPGEGPITVFFVDYKPEPPAGGRYIRPLFNVPQLDINKFLQPPFDKSNSNKNFEQLFREGLVEKFEPIAMTTGARKVVRGIHIETSKGLWEEFCKE